MNRQVYLDHNASTPVHPEVVDAMLPYFSERFGNPSSVHGFGREAREGLETAREQVAHFLRVGKEEVVFTSGGTESDNMERLIAYDKLAREDRLVRMRAREVAQLKVDQGLPPFPDLLSRDSIKERVHGIMRWCSRPGRPASPRA